MGRSSVFPFVGGIAKPGLHALRDKRALEFHDGGQDGKNLLADRRGRVKRFGQGDERDPKGIECFERVE